MGRIDALTERALHSSTAADQLSLDRTVYRFHQRDGGICRSDCPAADGNCTDPFLLGADHPGVAQSDLAKGFTRTCHPVAKQLVSNRLVRNCLGVPSLCRVLDWRGDLGVLSRYVGPICAWILAGEFCESRRGGVAPDQLGLPVSRCASSPERNSVLRKNRSFGKP